MTLIGLAYFRHLKKSTFCVSILRPYFKKGAIHLKFNFSSQIFFHNLVTMDSAAKIFHDLESPILHEHDNAKRELAECFAASECNWNFRFFFEKCKMKIC